MSRDIPIVVDPSYETRNRRGSEPNNISMSNIHKVPDEKQFLEANKRFFDRRSQRRHSEDPNTIIWKTNYNRSPSYEEGKVDGERSKRRGSTPVYWNNPRGGRDRFEQIVERMMNANDEELLSGLMERDFGPFDIEEIQEKSCASDGATSHEKVQRSPSAPAAATCGQFGAGVSGTARPFTMKFKKDKIGSIEIPVQICTTTDDNNEKTQKKSEKVKHEGNEAGNIDKDVTSHPMKEKGIQTDNRREVKISADATTRQNNREPVKGINAETDNVLNPDTENILNDIEKSSRNDCAKQDSETVDEANKLSHIKQIESALKQTHEQVRAFNGTNSKNGYKQYLILEELLMKSLMSLDAVEANGSSIVREARKSVVMQVQQELQELEKKRIPFD